MSGEVWYCFVMMWGCYVINCGYCAVVRCGTVLGEVRIRCSGAWAWMSDACPSWYVAVLKFFFYRNLKIMSKTVTNTFLMCFASGSHNPLSKQNKFFYVNERYRQSRHLSNSALETGCKYETTSVRHEPSWTSISPHTVSHLHWLCLFWDKVQGNFRIKWLTKFNPPEYWHFSCVS